MWILPRLVRCIPFLLVGCSCIASLVQAAGRRPLQNLQVTLRGHKYDISGVETVQDLQLELEKKSGVDPKQQGRVLFGGKRLSAGGSASLEEEGVTDGAKLNLVPGKAKSSSSSSSSSSTSARNSKPSNAGASSSSSSSSSTSLPPSSDSMSNQLNEFMKSMGGQPGGGNGENAPPANMEESLKMMGDMMNSPIFQEFMSDPEKLEQSRQMILSNPLLKSMMAGMPGMEEMLNDPVAWREAMQAAANLYQNMDPQDLMKAMMGDDAAAGGMMPPGGAGLFDGLDTGTTSMAAALDELSEGED